MNYMNLLVDGGIWPRQGDKFTISDSLLVTVISIVLVFAVLAIIIGVTHGIKIGTDKADDLIHINPRNPSNKLLNEDEDAVAAVIAATIDFHKETNQNAEIKSIERIDE